MLMLGEAMSIFALQRIENRQGIPRAFIRSNSSRFSSTLLIAVRAFFTRCAQVYLCTARISSAVRSHTKALPSLMSFTATS